LSTDNRAAGYAGGLAKILIVYAVILGLAGLQFVVAYEHVDTWQMFGRMLAIAIVEASLAAMFFMHLGSEKRGFVMFVAVFTLFVLAAMQFGWSDSFRMMLGAAPNSSYQTPTH
jgi:heme/copper-type cytochrome/quinol oxidase subunit 4